jgi:hypothetical protein
MTKCRVVALLAVLILVAGCASVNRRNYDKVESGMTVTQVEKILGHKDTGGQMTSPEFPEATEVWTWEDNKGKKTIVIGFKSGHVIGKRSTGL